MRHPVMPTDIIASQETLKYSTFRDPGGQGQGLYHHFTKVIASFNGQCHPYFRGETMHVR